MAVADPDPVPALNNVPSFAEAVRVWVRIAALSFGGPAGQIAVMHRILVAEKKWIGEERFLHALNFCMLLPGPEAQQLATYIGWLLHKTKGGLVAGTLFILPGLVAIMVLSWLYVLWGGTGPIAALFFGLKAAVLAIVFQSVFRIGGRALGNPARRATAAAAFLALFLFQTPFPIVVLGAGLVGYAASHRGRSAFVTSGHGEAGGSIVSDAQSALGVAIPAHAAPHRAWAIRIGAILLILWLTPLLLLFLLAPDSVFTHIAGFFSRMAVVTFGGAYAVLAYVAQAAVENYGWLRPGEMLDGLGLAETTPGPLIMVTQFVGFLGAYRDPGDLSPLLAATLGGLLTTWVTFTPCFLWIFLGAPYVERLRANRALAGAMAAITAAVVGVILNLACWFALHYLFGQSTQRSFGPIRFDLPVWSSIDPLALLLSIAALAAMFRFRAGLLPVLGACAAAGLILRHYFGS
ncbi:chromate efflux transporter [Sphingosinicella rhizophila]|uniref:Chromate efflux transporter n=1 Tax=Sphingosinicella rhizophila TaxID=3050082 RepID=A0ABU3QAY1_9SPHN|nr:chromate efflux transporter [Sphingosinicella sp. GR2756]MDT9600560.1 chromate efflux transporter [Sphingosinicella sp. GR2756]